LKFSNNLYTINRYCNYTTISSIFYYKSLSYLSIRCSTTTYISHKYVNFIILFLKKEKRYTKLKYSRVPQVDFVSGGVASLLAGLLGFLVTEKVGFELIDSGDFYILLTYVIIVINNIRVFYKITVI